MITDCLSEEFFENFSYEESTTADKSHYKWRSFQRRTFKISQDDTKI